MTSVLPTQSQFDELKRLLTEQAGQIAEQREMIEALARMLIHPGERDNGRWEYPMCFAAARGDIAAMNFLINVMRHDINEVHPADGGFTPLELAITKQKYTPAEDKVKTVRWLLEHKAEIRDGKRGTQNTLKLAQECGNPDISNVVLQAHHDRAQEQANTANDTANELQEIRLGTPFVSHQHIT